MYFLIVIYNKKILESNSFKFLFKKENIIIFDNSDIFSLQQNNELFCQKEKIMYFTKNKNIGLSKAYNYVFDKIKNLDFKYLVICDDDTEFNIEFLEELKNKQKDFLLPRIYSNQEKKIVFPNFDKKIIRSINSGLVLSKKIIKNERYDEKYFCYCSDFVFIENLQKKYDFEILESIINQNFFEHSLNYNKQIYQQLKIRLNDTKKYYNFFKYQYFKIGYVFENYKKRKNKEIFKLLFI